MQTSLDEIGKSLKDIRRQKHYSLTQVANAIGIAPMLLTLLEAGAGSLEEFSHLIEIWTNYLNIDTDTYVMKLPTRK